MKTWSTSVLTPRSYDTEPTILVTFEGAKYIFNVGENTNRAFTQSQQQWKRTSGIFLTQANSQRTGGIGGMLMCLADGGIPKLDVVGPPGLGHLLASMRGFIARHTMAVTLNEFLPDINATSPEVVFKDDNITVHAFPISTQLPFPNYEKAVKVTVKAGKRKRSQERSVPEKDKPSKVAKLEGDDVLELNGDTLREGAVQLMFATKPAHKKIYPTQDRTQGGELDEYRRWTPTWFHKQLPTFSFPPTHPQESTLAYVIVGPRVRGKVDGAKLYDLGVPFNDLRSKLIAGETITFQVQGPGGNFMRTVRPEEVMSKSEPPSAVVILDVPSVEMIPSVVRSFDTVYKPFRSSNAKDLENHTVKVVYHLLGPGVLEDERYQAFMRGFPQVAEHIVSSPEYNTNPVTFTSFAFNQWRLSQLDSEIFTVPKFSLSPAKKLADIPSLPPRVHIMAPNLHVLLRPSGPAKTDASKPDDRFHSVVSSNTSKWSNLPVATQMAFAEARKAISRHPKPKGRRWADVKVLPLGTSSAAPNKYRNVLSTLIQTPDGNILLDAGEGTLGQLTRRFGIGSKGDVDDVLANLKCIFVSHSHADHIMGLVQILRRRKLLTEPPKHPLYVVTIRKAHIYLLERHEVEDIGISDDPKENGVIPILSEALNHKYSEYPPTGMWRIGGTEPWLDINLSRQRGLDMARNLNLDFFKTIDVYHRTKAFAAFFQHKSGWSIAFSGDTMPTPNLTKNVQNATLLIHEATMADSEEQMAAEKAHSTVGQAIQVARDIRAQNVLLTHFSARYPKMPPSIVAPPEENTSARREPLVTIAFDLVELKMDEMWKMNLYLPAIEQCFMDSSSEEGEENLHETIPGAVDG